MNAITRLSKLSVTVAKRTGVSRAMISGSAKACGGAKHDSHGHGDHGHDDHHHHHVMWDLPFNKGTIAFIVFGTSAIGVAAVLMSCSLQNKKHGFST